MNIEKRLYVAMKQKGINQRTLAKTIGCSETVISKWLNNPQNFRLSTVEKLENALGVKLLEVTESPFPDSVFSLYEPNKSHFSDSLFWEYDNETFIPSEHKEIVVSRVAERGRLNDYFAAFDACGGIDGFKKVYISLKKPNKYSANFICTALNIKQIESPCYI